LRIRAKIDAVMPFSRSGIRAKINKISEKNIFFSQIFVDFRAFARKSTKISEKKISGRTSTS